MWTGPALWIMKVLLITGSLATLYSGIAWHYYESGYAAHEAEVAQQIRDKNTAIAVLNAKIGHDQLTESSRIGQAVRQAIELQSRYPVADQMPGQCTPLGDGVLAKLNAIE